MIVLYLRDRETCVEARKGAQKSGKIGALAWNWWYAWNDVDCCGD